MMSSMRAEEGMAQVQLAGHIGRRHADHERLRVVGGRGLK